MVIPSLCSNCLVAKKYSGMGLGTLRKVFFTNKGRDGFSHSTVVIHIPLQCGTDRHLVVVKAADLRTADITDCRPETGKGLRSLAM